MPNGEKIDIKTLTDAVLKNEAALIEYSEKRFEQELIAASEKICKDYRACIVLLSGPSGSGKTTTANMLRSMIEDIGRKCCVLSLDDFFLNHGEYPKKADGSEDFESIYALDLKTVEKCICELIVSGKTLAPKFDFKSQHRSEKTNMIDVGEKGIVIIEGIHALNPLIFDAVNANFDDDMNDVIKKVFVSVESELYYEGKKVFGADQIRLLRRVIRDDLYRGFDIENTLSIWDSVLAAEKSNMTGYHHVADIQIDTFHKFEPYVYAGFIRNNMMSEIEKVKNSEYYSVFQNIQRLPSVPVDKIPQTSLIREFVPGGKYENLY